MSPHQTRRTVRYLARVLAALLRTPSNPTSQLNSLTERRNLLRNFTDPATRRHLVNLKLAQVYDLRAEHDSLEATL